MRLAQFILIHREAILVAWDNFAATLLPNTRSMDAREMRDHAEQMLLEIVADIDLSEKATTQRIENSRSQGTGIDTDTASEDHAESRLRSGFSINQLVAEYRALRTSVLTLWSELPTQDVELSARDTLRFNEAIDKGLAESVARYSQTVNESQDIFLGVLGHDLRAPLGAILLSAEFF